MIAITPQQLSARRKPTKPMKVCSKCRQPKDKFNHYGKVCTDCHSEQKRRQRSAKGHLTIIG